MNLLDSLLLKKGIDVDLQNLLIYIIRKSVLITSSIDSEKISLNEAMTYDQLNEAATHDQFSKKFDAHDQLPNDSAIHDQFRKDHEIFCHCGDLRNHQIGYKPFQNNL